MSASHQPRRGGRFHRKAITPIGGVYAAALELALDRTATPEERGRANRLMRELASEMRTDGQRPRHDVESLAMQALVCGAFDQLAFGREQDLP